MGDLDWEIGERAEDFDAQARRQRAVGSGAQWSVAVLLQIERVVDVGRDLIEQHRRRPWREPDWDEDQYRATWYRLEADRHFLLVASNNLVRAIDFLDPPAHVDTFALDGIRRLSAVVKTLRDCNEHWNEEVREWVKSPSKLTGKAFNDLAQLGPEADIRSHRWTAPGAATVSGVLALEDLQTAAQSARRFYSDLSRSWFIWSDWPQR